MHGLVVLLAIAATAGCSSVSGIDPVRQAAPDSASVAVVDPSAEADSAADGSGETAAAVPGPLVMAASAPLRVSIPAIGVDAAVVGWGLTRDGALDVPPGAFPAGWFTGAPTPGELGPAIIAGHVDWGGSEGVFYDLRDLGIGDMVSVARADKTTAVFRVTRAEHFPKDDFPTDLVYGNLTYAGLRLITCGGSFDRGERSYVDNIVVFAELVDVGSS